MAKNNKNNQSVETPIDFIKVLVTKHLAGKFLLPQGPGHILEIEEAQANEIIESGYGVVYVKADVDQQAKDLAKKEAAEAKAKAKKEAEEEAVRIEGELLQ